jgi:HSP20 family protein
MNSNHLIKQNPSSDTLRHRHQHHFGSPLSHLTNNPLERFFASDWFNQIEQMEAKTNVIALSDNKVRIEVALPGYEKDDIKVERDGDTLYISAANKKEHGTEKNGTQYFRREILTSHQSMEFPLQEDAEIEHVAFKNGILEIDYNHKENIKHGKRRAIEIKTN